MDGWAAPQRDVFSGDRSSAVRPAPTALNDIAAAPPLDQTLAEAKVQRDIATLQRELREAAAAEPHIAAQLGQWIECASVTNAAMQPPESVRACAVRPDAERFLSMPFARRCPIPTTEPMAQRWPPPRWPAHVPRPTSVMDTFVPKHGEQLAKHMAEVEAYNKQRVEGTRARRPEPKSWSDAARYPWLRRRAMRFIGAKCELLGAGGPALATRLHKEAMLWLFKDYPHRRLLSLIVHGVRMSDGMEVEMHTSVAANLDSLYDVEGGADAVANESAVLQKRGWLMKREQSSVRSRLGGAAERAPASPMITGPRGAVKRKDGGPPRGVADDTHPRKEVYTIDSGEKVDSINNASGRRVGKGGPDREAWPNDEVKPRAEDASVDTLIVWCLADLLGVAPIAVLFDYKYFFHVLTYEMAEIWKRGLAVPAARRSGGASGALDWMLELVMAMGWTRASLVAQDLANALVWRLMRDTDAASEAYVARMREQCPAFDAAWRLRMSIAKDSYGTHARLYTALQYTDDMLAVAAGPTAMSCLLVSFCRLVGPALYVSENAREAARGTAARHRAILVGEEPPRGVKPVRGAIRPLARSQRAKPDERVVQAKRVGPGGNPFDGPDAREATLGFACLCWRAIAPRCRCARYARGGGAPQPARARTQRHKLAKIDP